MRIFHILAIASLILLSACGQKGPLYHPEPEPATENAQPEEEETEESDSDS